MAMPWFFAYIEDVTSGEIGLSAGAEGATAPETLRQTDPRDGLASGKRRRRALAPGVRRRDNTLRHSDRWGFLWVFGDWSPSPGGSLDAGTRRISFTSHTLARAPCGARRQDGSIRRLRNAGAISSRRAQGTPAH